MLRERERKEDQSIQGVEVLSALSRKATSPIFNIDGYVLDCGDLLHEEEVGYGVMAGSGVRRPRTTVRMFI